MRTIENSILQLAEDIYAGKCGYQKAVSRFEAIEKKFESVEHAIDYPEFPATASQGYLDELIGRVRLGLFSKPLILDMAKAADEIYRTENAKNIFKKPAIIGIAIAVVAILFAIIAISIGD